MYNNYAKYFDKVFPANPKTVSFLKEHLSGYHILDIGCGSGEMCNALSADYKVTGMDLDDEMIAYAKSKYDKLDFQVGNMLEMNQEIFDSIYCIGNTLVHLPTKEDIQQFLDDVYHKVEDDGVLILQIINYDRIIDEDIDSLPTIENEGVSFIRNYERVGDKIRFSTILSTPDEAYDGYVDLIPLRKEELSMMLTQAGFGSMRCYSGFTNKEYTQDAYALVVVANK